jgi:hypothetical protein
MQSLFYVLTLLGCAVLYLSHRRQGWLKQALPAAPTRAVGGLLLLAALVCGLRAFSLVAALFAWIAVAMLGFSLLPFLSLLIPKEDA